MLNWSCGPSRTRFATSGQTRQPSLTWRLTMAKYVPDITSNRWVIFAETRSRRPREAPTGVNVNKICVFCPGFEKLPGEEIYRIGAGAPNERGWQVRVIKNKYPITDFHEVIIHSPDDAKDFDQLPLSHVGLILKAYRDRFNANLPNGQVIIFNNVGEVAGASLNHPHSQLVVVPKQINLDTLKFEAVVNVVEENNRFVTFCPNFSQWPFEVWIAPKRRNELFGDLPDDDLVDLAQVLQKSLRRLLSHLASRSHDHPGVPVVTFKHGPGYNFYIYHGRDWYLRIVPRLVHRAGFELGTGLSVNILAPEDAAEALKAEKVE